MLVKLKLTRIKKGVSIYDMAKYLNITPSFYSQIENEKRRLYYDTAIKLAHYFGVTPYELFETKDDETKKYEKYPCLLSSRSIFRE